MIHAWRVLEGRTSGFGGGFYVQPGQVGDMTAEREPSCPDLLRPNLGFTLSSCGNWIRFLNLLLPLLSQQVVTTVIIWSAIVRMTGGRDVAGPCRASVSIRGS